MVILNTPKHNKKHCRTHQNLQKEVNTSECTHPCQTAFIVRPSLKIQAKEISANAWILSSNLNKEKLN